MAFQKCGGGIIWIASFSLLCGSYALFHYLGDKVNTVFIDNEMFFYQYNSPLVILEAIGLMILFAKINIFPMNVFVKKIVPIFVNASLVVYLAHMHPIIKEYYITMGVFSWIDVNNLGIYVLETGSCVFVIFIVGVVLSIPITQLSSSIYNKFKNRYFNEG